ncbi:MAG: glutamate racemase [Micavibrio sp.]|nr:MAG: glutamate racemase [Micavibrio sp.]
MKLGIFDSGLGGLLVAKSIKAHMPSLDMIYLGDTLHVPYGNRSEEAIYEYCYRGVDFLFSQGCNLVIMACNTGSAAALRRLQQEYLPGRYPDRRILGVVVPTLEAAVELGHEKIGLIATNYIIQSDIYEEELQRINPKVAIYPKATPLLVPLIENDGMEWIGPIIRTYLQPLMAQKIQSLILGCTHYPFLKSLIRKEVGDDLILLSQDEIIPQKLEEYLKRHPEISEALGRSGIQEFFVTDVTDAYQRSARFIYNKEIFIGKANIWDLH